MEVVDKGVVDLVVKEFGLMVFDVGLFLYILVIVVGFGVLEDFGGCSLYSYIENELVDCE